MKIVRTYISGLYRLSVLYYMWLLFIIGNKIWPQLKGAYQTGSSPDGFFLMFIQLFLFWVHFGILRGIFKNRSWALMASLLLSGTHSLCALVLPGSDIYTHYFMVVSLTVFATTLMQFFSQLAELRV